MVEGGHQLDLARQQHAVAEYVAGHVADADDAEGLALDVSAEHAEVALDRLPGPARGDAHLLVVVAGGAAGGEGILQPVIQLHGDGIGGVGKARGTLVRGDHQVGIRIVVDPGAHRVDDLAVNDVVGQFQQGADIELVTVPDLVEAGVPVQPGDALGDETALGSGGHDDRVLDHLGLHQAQHLGAVILATIRPAYAAAGHLAAAQVDALETGAVDEDLVQRPRFRQSVDEARFELEAQVLQLAGRLLEVIAAHGGFDQVEHLPEDAVLVEGFDFVERFQVTVALGGKLVRALVRIEMQVEHAHQAQGNGRMRGQGFNDQVAGVGKLDLVQVGRVGAQQVDVRFRQAGGEQQPIEGIVFAAPVPGIAEQLGEIGRQLRAVADTGILEAGQTEMVEPQRLAFQLHVVGLLHLHLQPHRFQDRHGMTEGDGIVQRIELDGVEPGAGIDGQAYLQAAAVHRLLHLFQVAQGFVHIEVVAVTAREHLVQRLLWEVWQAAVLFDEFGEILDPVLVHGGGGSFRVYWVFIVEFRS